MNRMCRLLAIAVTLFLTIVAGVFAKDKSSGPRRGALVVDGGGCTDATKDKFMAMAGGSGAKIVVIPTGASAFRFGANKTIVNPDWRRDRPEWKAYQEYLEQWFGTSHVEIVHTRDPDVANSKHFVEPLRTANAVFLGAGNPGRIAQAYLGTRTEKQLRALLDRGGVVLGCSAGSIILGSFIVRGLPNSGILMVKGHDRGFSFLKNVANDPHLSQAKRERELLDVTHAHPNLLGIGIDEDAGLLVHGNCFEVIGSGRVAIYDSHPHPPDWYYWLKPGEHFDLSSWQKSSCSP